MASKQTFLQHLQSHYQAKLDRDYCTFPDADAASGKSAQLVLLNHYELLEVQGTDSERFLQGQLSCDVREVSMDSARWGTYNNAKGRMHASFLTSAAPDVEAGYHLRMATDVATHCREVLAKYIVFSKAEIQSLSDEWLVFGITGSNAKAALETALETALTGSLKGDLSVHSSSGWQCLVLSEQLGVYELHVPADQASAVWDKLCDVAQITNSNRWDKALIEMGMAEVRAENLETLIPQMMNFDLNGGINFKKGCYTGQEVIARLHYRGEAKQRLFRIAGPGASLGTQLFTEARRSAVGEVVAWYQDGNEGSGLAVIRIDSADEALKDSSGHSFQAEALQTTD